MTVIQCFLSTPYVVLIFLLLRMPAILIGCATHETGRIALARISGDDTAKRHGYTALNPFRFIDPLGLVLFVFCGFGWPRQAPVNVRKLRHRRLSDVFVTLAGPLFNLIIAFVTIIAATIMLQSVCDAKALSVVGLHNLLAPYTPASIGMFSSEYVPHAAAFCAMLGADVSAYASPSLALWAALDVQTPILYLRLLLMQCAYVNVGMAIFNMIPVPPLDMFHLINDNLLRGRLLKSKQGFIVCVIVLMVVLIGFERLNYIIVTPITQTIEWFIRVAQQVFQPVLGA